MRQLLNPGIPWPIGARLRFKPDARVKPQYTYLRGTPVLIIGPLTWFEESGWRQRVAAFGARRVEDQIGFALPEQLEPIPGEDPEGVWEEEAIEDGQLVSLHAGASEGVASRHSRESRGLISRHPGESRDPVRVCCFLGIERSPAILISTKFGKTLGVRSLTNTQRASALPGERVTPTLAANDGARP